MNKSKGNRVGFITLGCKLNYSETSTLAREFEEKGYVKVPANQPADIYVINTCSVTSHADKKCRNAIRKLNKQNPGAIIAVTGCYAQLKPSEILSIEGVDLVLGADEKSNLFMRVNQLIHCIDYEGNTHSVSNNFSCEISKVETIFPAYSSDDRTRSFLKVQDGCDYHCSYCTIPLARGKSRNLPVELLVKEAIEIASKGIKEIVLTGVNTGDFGKSTGEKFTELLTALQRVEGIERIRISSLEPDLITNEIIGMVSAGNKLLPHFHIPLQSGSNKILAAMRRRYNRELFSKKVESIRSAIELPFIGVDIITGFPGESDEDFNETLSFIEKVKPTFLHVFPYSQRENTPASSFENQIDERTKIKRVAALNTLSDKLYKDFVIQNRGRKELVLFESSQKGGMMYGYSRNYIKVERPFNRELIGKIIELTLD